MSFDVIMSILKNCQYKVNIVDITGVNFEELRNYCWCLNRDCEAWLCPAASLLLLWPWWILICSKQPITCDLVVMWAASEWLQLCSSYVGGGVRAGVVFCPETGHLGVRWRCTQEAAGEDLPARLPEVLGQEGIEDGVDAWVSVGQAVGDNSKGKGGVIQRKGAKLHPHGDDMVRQPAESEGSNEQENSLSCLQQQNTGRNSV